MKRVFIIHGWGGNPEEGWFPWLKEKLEQDGFSVTVPDMPNTEVPEISAWVNHVKEVVGEADENTYFVGHSIGCQTILRYLESLRDDKKVGGAVFVAGWFHLVGLESEEEWQIAKPWLETPIDLNKVKQHTEKFVAIFSDTDSVVPVSELDMFEKEVGAHCILEHEKGHFSGEDGVTMLESAYHAVLGLAKV